MVKYNIQTTSDSSYFPFLKVLINSILVNCSKDYLNNIYKDTPHYLSSKDPAVVPENWIGQFSKVFSYHPNVEFIWVHDGELFPEWSNHKNIKIISQKDLTL